MMLRGVLVVTPCYPRFPGDFNGSFVRDLCLRIHARGFDLTVLAPRSRTMGSQNSPYRIRRFPYLPIRGAETLPEETMKGASMARLSQLLPYLTSAILHASCGGHTLIHTHLAIPLGFATAFAGSKAPRIITCHGSDCTLPLDNPVYLPFTRYSLRHANVVVAVSHYVEGLAKRLGARNTETIYLGIDTSRFRPSLNKAALREKLGIPDDTVVIGTLGRLVPSKCVDTLIEAAIVVSKRLDCVFLIGGDGPDRQRLVELTRARGLNNVFFMGAIHNAPDFLSALDVFALTSSREGLSLSLQEAMASGCTPVASNGNGSDEVIVDSVNGFLYDDEQALAPTIIEAVDAYLGAKARETIVNRFNAETGADLYAELYNRLAF